MAIATLSPTKAKPVVPELPKAQPESYQSVVVDDNQIPLKTLTAYVEGSPWTVDYYGQVISGHNDLRDVDPGQVSIYQQYTKINKVEIRVTSPLTSSQDSNTSFVTVSGSANVHAFMTPNVGDVFIAEAGTNKHGIFHVTNVERKTFDRDAIFLIDYNLIGYTDARKDLVSDLEKKVIRQYFFDKDRLVEGLTPVLQAEQFEQAQSLSEYYKRLCEFYFKTFFNREHSTLIIPGQDTAIYDAFLVRFVLKIVSSQDAPEVRLVKDLCTELDPYLEQDQFWSVMYERNVDQLVHCNEKMNLVMTRGFDLEPTLNGLRYTRIEYVVYPERGDQTAFSGKVPVLKSGGFTGLQTTTSQSGSISGMLQNSYIDQNSTIPLIKDVVSDSSYVLSHGFYTNEKDLTVLESLVLEYLRGEAIQQKRLLAVLKTYPNWNRLNQFYYIPILLALIKSANRGLY